MKLVKSKCEKAWFFNVRKKRDELSAGLACFLPGCNDKVIVEMNNMSFEVSVPSEGVESRIPIKIANARLSLLVSDAP